MTDTITVEGDQIRNLFAMTPLFLENPARRGTPPCGKAEPDDRNRLPLPLLTAGYNGTKSKGNTA